MRLRFVGTNGSMGLRFGEVYRLTVKPWNNGVRITDPIACPYDTDAAFWRNWIHPDVELRTVMESAGRELRQAHIPEAVPLKKCSRTEYHGSHNWQTMSTDAPYAWCSGKTDKE